MESAVQKKQTFLQLFIRYKKTIIFLFYLYYLLIFAFGIYSAFIINKQTTSEIYDMGKSAGNFAVVFFCLSLMPGIARRFKIRMTVIQIIMLFRRQIGIVAFLFGFLHYGILRLFPILFAGAPFDTSPPIFEIFGTLTLYPMALLFLTSNDISVRKMGKSWKILHDMSYIIVWTLFLHVALYNRGAWMLLIGFFAVAETSSLIYSNYSSRISTKVV